MTTREDPMGIIDWGTCEVCDGPIGPTDKAAIELPPVDQIRFFREAWARSEAALSLDQPGDLAEALALPALAHWRVVHNACSDRASSTAYDLLLTEVRTHADLRRWTEHLRSKTWFAHTDWDDLIRKAVA